MNVLFVASDNNYTSGAFLSMVKLNQLLISEHFVSTFVILPNEGDGERLLEEAGIPFEIVPSRNWIVDIEEGKTEEREREKEAELQSNESAINRIVEIIYEKSIDILHINTSYSYVGACAAVKTNIPFVWHIREFLEEDQNRKIWNREKGYQLMRRADAVAAISDSIYQKYVKLLVPKKIHIIYNGIDEKIFFDPEKRILENPIIKFGIVGGIVPHKGQEELIRACGILKRKGISDFQLSIVGKGKEHYVDFLKELVCQEGLQENVKLTEPSDNVSSVLKEIDVLFVCSRSEAFGRITVEGMMSGCLIIGADTSGTLEILENGRSGYLYQQGNSESLMQLIYYVLEHKDEAKKISSAGQETALKKYTAMRNAEEIYALYMTIKEQSKEDRGCNARSSNEI